MVKNYPFYDQAIPPLLLPAYGIGMARFAGKMFSGKSRGVMAPGPRFVEGLNNIKEGYSFSPSIIATQKSKKVKEGGYTYVQ
jgi:hypothetical protein